MSSSFAIAFAHFLYFIAIAFGVIIALLLLVGLVVCTAIISRKIHCWISESRRVRNLRRETVVGCRAAAVEAGGDVEMNAVPRIEVSLLGAGAEKKLVAPVKCHYSGYL
ncbi:hypothetical protein N7G274_005497 [Stereocaulon virgatum]|uniref:ATP synthase F0 subunit 8 n=1 Tax=Stereocaulon virgatum TaxID=373712 RepID=A0ABR4A7Q7_9LECA